MLHVISARCVACHLHMIAPGPLERTCWRRGSEEIVKNLELRQSRQLLLVSLLLLSKQICPWDTLCILLGCSAAEKQRIEFLFLLLLHQMETPVSSMKVAVHRRSPQTIVELVGYGSVVWPDSLSELLVQGVGVWLGGGGGGCRTAADVLLSDCQYSKGTTLYG